MSTKKAAIEILTTLDEEPRVNFFPWELDVRNSATASCKTLCRTGLLSSLLKNAQWADYPTNITTDAQGNVAITPPARQTQRPNEQRRLDGCLNIQRANLRVDHWGRDTEGSHREKPRARDSSNHPLPK